MFRKTKRHVPPPELVGPHQSTRPTARPENVPDWSGFRHQVLIWTAVVLVITGIGIAAYGPWFGITKITVTGTRLLVPKSVQQVAQRYVEGRRWLILPNRTLWVLSAHGLQQHLESAIKQRLSIEQVSVIKQPPHSLKIVVTERTPVATWSDGTAFGTVDRHGVIIDLRPQPVEHLPIVRDENATLFSVDSSVVKSEVMVSVVSLGELLKQANIAIKEFLIPVPNCPVPTIIEVPKETNSNSQTNTYDQTNSNQSELTNQPINSSPASIVPPCDKQALRFSSQEIHAQLTDGPRVLFDRHSDLKQAVQALQRVLSEHTDKKLTSIDVRFGERVYVK